MVGIISVIVGSGRTALDFEHRALLLLAAEAAEAAKHAFLFFDGGGIRLNCCRKSRYKSDYVRY